MKRLAIATSLALSACGGGTTSAASPVTPGAVGPGTPPSSSAAPAAASAPSAPPQTTSPAKAPAAAAKPDSAAAPTDTKPRQKLYRMTPHGLEVEISGVLFRVRARAVRRGAGWGVKATVKVKSKDRQRHVLLGSAGGPLAFSANVDRGGQVETTDDTRKGKKLEVVDEGKPLTLSRSWPDKGKKALGAGQSLVLQVGLWGLGADADSGRPVRRFFQVKMVVGKGRAKPQAVVSPPGSAK